MIKDAVELDDRIELIIDRRASPDTTKQYVRQLVQDALGGYQQELVDTAVHHAKAGFGSQARYTITEEAMHKAQRKFGLVR